MSICRAFSTTVAHIRRIWSDKGLFGDCIQLLDLLLLLAGVRAPSTQTWTGERKIRIFLNFLFVYHVVICLLQFTYILDTTNDTTLDFVFGVLKITSVCVITLKILTTVMLRQSMMNVRQFITSDRIHSGDKDYDKLLYQKFNDRARTLLRVIFGLILFDTVFMSVPNSAASEMLKLQLQFSGQETLGSRIVSVSFTSLLPLSMAPRSFGNLAFIATLLLGMRMKLAILTHRFRRMLNQPMGNVQRYYERMELEMRNTLNQQLEFWRNLQTLKDLVGKTFFLIHYFAIFSIGALFYVSRRIGFNFMSTVFVLSTLWYLVEYFLYCYLVEVLQDEVASFECVIFELCSQLPRSRQSISQYKQMKSTLMIIWVNTVNGMSMNCLELFEISMQAFVQMLDTAYTMFMFLINIT